MSKEKRRYSDLSEDEIKEIKGDILDYEIHLFNNESRKEWLAKRIMVAPERRPRENPHSYCPTALFCIFLDALPLINVI